MTTTARVYACFAPDHLSAAAAAPDFGAPRILRQRFTPPERKTQKPRNQLKRLVGGEGLEPPTSSV